MPTGADFQELIDNCDTTWTVRNGISGMLFTSRNNGNSIFLPAAGYYSGDDIFEAGSFGNYWSSSLLYTEGYPYGAWYFHFDSDHRYYVDYDERKGGRLVRAVYHP